MDERERNAELDAMVRDAGELIHAIRSNQAYHQAAVRLATKSFYMGMMALTTPKHSAAKA